MSAAVTELSINNIWLDLSLIGLLKFRTNNNGKGIITGLVTNELLIFFTIIGSSDLQYCAYKRLTEHDMRPLQT